MSQNLRVNDESAREEEKEEINGDDERRMDEHGVDIDDDDERADLEQPVGVRREIRENYRDLIEKSEKITEDVDEISASVLRQNLSAANSLNDQVKLPRESSYDTCVLKNYADVGKLMVGALQADFQQFDEDDFAKKLISFVKHVDSGTVIESDEDEERGESTSTKKKNDEILTKADWQKLGGFFSTFFNIAPGLDFVSSSLEQVNEQKKVERRKREPREKDAIAEIVRPVELTDASGKGEEEKTHSMVVNVKRCLQMAYEKNGNRPIPYFHFVVNPTSFAKTVENMFYLSFLIKDGLAEMSMNKKGLPIIGPTEENAGATMQNKGKKKEGGSGESDEDECNQCIIQIGYDDWEKIVRAFDIDEALIVEP